MNLVALTAVFLPQVAAQGITETLSGTASRRCPSAHQERCGCDPSKSLRHVAQLSGNKGGEGGWGRRLQNRATCVCILDMYQMLWLPLDGKKGTRRRKCEGVQAARGVAGNSLQTTPLTLSEWRLKRLKNRRRNVHS
eukprot:GEMP01091448.1.p1 GENE.GEMP01091448.1~~GEMP01091448.1.p1  ORF type:complete len:137 (+),score=5.84 GEMP01091448.1:130-540(+)